MYALPILRERSDTDRFSLFYFVFFGMMVADIGYGLLLIGGDRLCPLKPFKLKPSTAKNLSFLQPPSEFQLPLWGVVYGSFFGFEMPLALISTTSNAMTILIPLSGLWFYHRLSGPFLGGMKMFAPKTTRKPIMLALLGS